MKKFKLIPNTKYKISNEGEVLGIHGQLLKGYKDSGGYHQLKMLLDGKVVTRCVHRLVWQAWKGEIPDGIWINHIDGNKLNNNLENLELTTPGDNHRHAYRVLQREVVRGLKIHTAVLSPIAIEAIHALNKIGWSQRKIATAFGVSQPTIQSQLKKRV